MPNLKHLEISITRNSQGRATSLRSFKGLHHEISEVGSGLEEMSRLGFFRKTFLKNFQNLMFFPLK